MNVTTGSVVSSTNNASVDFDVVVVGGGPTGLAAALAMASTGARTAIAAPPHRPAGDRPDMRTAALFPGSVAMLRHIGAWDDVAASCAPLAGIRLVDDRDALFRAPEVTFRASEIGRADFGYNVPNGALVEALVRRCRDAGSGVAMFDTAGVVAADIAGDRVTLTFAEGQRLTCSLVAAADGRRSLLRAAAGITTRHWSYD
ncbi:MAG: FAD-dependent monooxygenase, partial [Hyphomicrobiaceae bacterium]